MTEAEIHAKALKAFNFLVGQVLKQEPRANVQIVREILYKKLYTSASTSP